MFHGLLHGREQFQVELNMDTTFWLKTSLNCRLPGVSLGTGQEWLCAGFAFPKIPGDPGEGLVWHSPAGPVTTTHRSSQQGDSGGFLCHTFVLEREKGENRLRAAFNKGTQMFVFIAPPELIKILTFKKKKRKKLPCGNEKWL